MGPFENFYVLLHALRTVALRTLPRGAKSVLSVGCAGSWYFGWIAENYGRPVRHLGLERYAPQPPDLPPEVEWIANSAGNMRDVPDECVDLVFSGQNIEHLWPEEVVGFLCECHRVLRPGGVLALDSPNRIITAAQGWSHPEHTIELAPDEARDLIQAAGFDLTSLRGLWLCRDPGSGEMLPFDRVGEGDRWTLLARAVTAGADPADSFVWWAEARRTARMPDRDALAARIQQIFDSAWPERLQRLSSQFPVSRRRDGRRVARAPRRAPGLVLFGPGAPLRPGRYRASFALAAETARLPGDAAVAVVDVACGDPVRKLAERTLSAADLRRAGGGRVELDFALREQQFGVQFRIISKGRAAVEAAFSVGLLADGHPVVPAPAPPA